MVRPVPQAQKGTRHIHDETQGVTLCLKAPPALSVERVLQTNQLINPAAILSRHTNRRAVHNVVDVTNGEADDPACYLLGTVEHSDRWQRTSKVHHLSECLAVSNR